MMPFFKVTSVQSAPIISCLMTVFYSEMTFGNKIQKHWAWHRSTNGRRGL